MDASTERVEPKHVLFLQDFVDLAQPIGLIRPRFTGDGRWLTPLARAAQDEGESLRLRIGPDLASERITREVDVRVLGLREREDSLVLSLSWEATDLRRLFPVLDGDLELSPLGPDESRLVLSATYKPPLGAVGRVLDSVLFHRIAESTVRSFLRQVASSLEDDVAPGE